MPATPTAMLQSQPGASVVTAWPQLPGNGVGPQNLDLIHIAAIGGEKLVVVTYQGTVLRNTGSTPPTASEGVRVGRYLTRLSPSASTAAIFADAFSNPSLLDILHVVNEGGNISYYLDYLGVAHGS